MRRVLPTLMILAAAAAAGWYVVQGPLSRSRSDPASTTRSSAASPAQPGATPTPEKAPPEPTRLVEVAPVAQPGEQVVIELIDAPAERYAAAEKTEADRVYDAVVGKLNRPDVRYDPGLGRAARELAYQHSLFSGLVPPSVVDFLLRSSGAVDRTVTQGYTATGGDDLEAVTDRLERMLDQRQPGVRYRVGVGEAYIPGAKRPRFISILVSQRQIDVSPAPRRADPGTTWVLTGTLPRGWRDASALVLYPDGLMETREVTQQGRRFTLEVPTGTTRGTLDVSVAAVGPTGPSPLIQLPVTIGEPLPTEYIATVTPDEGDLRGRADAERLALKLLNADRARYGLPALIRDDALDDVARQHSVDMRDNGFFGHWSELSGTPGDRLAAAGYRAVTHGENVASAGAIHSAEAGLMKSLGHRRNILSSAFTHVGIGVAGRREGERTTWYLTQMFARPAQAIVPLAAAQRVYDRIRERRQDAGVGSIGRKRALDSLARNAARVAAAGGYEKLAQELMDSAKAAGETRRGAYAWVRVVTDIDTLELPDAVDSGDYRQVGIAVQQLDDHPNGLIGVALLLTGG